MIRDPVQRYISHLYYSWYGDSNNMDKKNETKVRTDLYGKHIFASDAVVEGCFPTFWLCYLKYVPQLFFFSQGLPMSLWWIMQMRSQSYTLPAAILSMTFCIIFYTFSKIKNIQNQVYLWSYGNIRTCLDSKQLLCHFCPMKSHDSRQYRSLLLLLIFCAKWNLIITIKFCHAIKWFFFVNLYF